MNRLLLRGSVDLQVFDPAGHLLHRERGSNLVVLNGKILAAQLINDEVASKPSHFGFGSSVLAVDEAQTALGTEFAFGGYARHAFSISRSSNIITCVTTGSGWQNNSGGNLSMREVGLFNAATSGTLFARFLTTAYTLAASNYVRLSWALTVG